MIYKTKLKGVYVFQPKVFIDSRGWFIESWSKQEFYDYGIYYEFIQDNHSFSAQKKTLRGLHFQSEPKAQTKLIRCTRGAILDVAVDIRKGSPTYNKWFSIELTSENYKQLLIPKGFAHGFITLTENVEVQYKTDEYYSPEHDCVVAWNDATIGIEWGTNSPILSEKDCNAPLLKDCEANFVY